MWKPAGQRAGRTGGSGEDCCEQQGRCEEVARHDAPGRAHAGEFRQDDTDKSSLFQHPSLYKRSMPRACISMYREGMHGNSTWQDGPCPHLVPVLSTVSVFFNGAWIRLVFASRS